MNKITGGLLSVLALVVFGLSFFHASWLAANPVGGPKLIAGKGVVPAFGTDGCVSQTNLGYNMAAVGPDVLSLQTAAGSMADAIYVGVEAKGDSLNIAPQFERKCASDKALPAGDANEVISAITKPELFWHAKGAGTATALVAKLPAGDKRHIVMGDAAAIKTVKAARPDARAIDVAMARQCTSDYKLSGLWGSMPASCKDGAMLLTLNDLGVTLWGWPNRLIARAADANITLIVADTVEGDMIKGLSDVTQYSDIARSYNGYIWIEEIGDLGPALRR